MGSFVKFTFSVIFTILTAILISRCIKYWLHMKYFRVLFPHQPGPCKLLEGLENGSEDIEVLSNGLALISTGLKFPPPYHNPKGIEGAIYSFDFTKPSSGVKKVKIKWSSSEPHDDFNPHGISSWQEDNITVLFVVSHDKKGEAVERFQYDYTLNSLRHLETIRSDEFRVINDVTATGKRSFYFTNYLYFTNELMIWIERRAMLSLGYVGYYDGDAVMKVLDDLHLPNGINQSPDGRYIYVAVPGSEEIRSYKRMENNKLSHLKTLVAHTEIDNINIDPITGDIWTGCHPIPWAKAKHFRVDSKLYRAPSQVLLIKAKDGQMGELTEIYAENGAHISGSSVAAYYDGKLLIGSVMDTCMFCEVTYKAPMQET